MKGRTQTIENKYKVHAETSEILTPIYWSPADKSLSVPTDSLLFLVPSKGKCPIESSKAFHDYSETTYQHDYILYL
jgi:hypothetical protein